MFGWNLRAGLLGERAQLRSMRPRRQWIAEVADLTARGKEAPGPRHGRVRAGCAGTRRACAVKPITSATNAGSSTMPLTTRL
jgi:hypothetical protein